MSATAPVPAPLAQLRDADEKLWHDVTISSSGWPSPGTDTVTQALAAALLGDRPLAVEIIRDGIGPRSMRPWPKLAEPKPIDPDAVITEDQIVSALKAHGIESRITDDSIVEAYEESTMLGDGGNIDTSEWVTAPTTRAALLAFLGY